MSRRILARPHAAAPRRDPTRVAHPAAGGPAAPKNERRPARPTTAGSRRPATYPDHWTPDTAAAVGPGHPSPAHTAPPRPALVRDPLDETIGPLLVPDQAEPGAGTLERGGVAGVEEGLAAVEAVVPRDHRMQGAAARLRPETGLAQDHEGLSPPGQPTHGRGGRPGWCSPDAGAGSPPPVAG